MADRKQMEASKIDALYSWLSYDLQKLKGELLNEMKYSSVQVGSIYQDMKNEKDKSSQAISQEIRYSYKQNQVIYDGLATMITQEVGDRLASMDEKVSSLEQIQSAVAEVMARVDKLENVDLEALGEKVKENVSEVVPRIEEAVSEIKYSYMQHQAIYDGVTALISGDVVAKLDDVQLKLSLLEHIEKTLVELNDKLADDVVEAVAEKTVESVEEQTRQMLAAVAAIPTAENVDYRRITDEVGDRVLELLSEIVVPQQEPVKEVAPAVEAKIDYDKVIYGTAEKVVESLPYPEKVDYRRIDNSFAKAVQSVQAQVNEDVIAAAVSAAVEKAMAAIDIDAIATAVAAKIEIPAPEAPVVPAAPEIDYELLSDMVAAKLAANNDQVYDVVLDETGIEQIAEKVSEKLGEIENVDYDRIAGIVEEKTKGEPCEEPTYDLVIDDEGIQAIAKSVSEELYAMYVPAEEEIAQEETTEEQVVVDEIVEESVAEVVEEPAVEETVEEAVAEVPVFEEETTEETMAVLPVFEEETAEEAVAVEPTAEETEEVAVVEEVVAEEPAVEETVVEEVATEEAAAAEPAPANEELAVAAEHYQLVDDQLVDAETGLVIRLKKSFTAKMKQSEDKVKGYYSDIKNELTSYKKINSNVSWHGDRFNYGRETVAKVNICGKTLCFYLALDPENPEYKTTVYHQKNVGNQKAYESTPFMVKIKSDAAAKKALRLVGYLAEKLGTEKENDFAPVDYVEEFAYASTKQLFDDGYIKVTKEKKVDLDF